MDIVGTVVAVLVLLAVPFVPRLWWSKDCEACDHVWQRRSRGGEDTRYECRQCDRHLRRYETAEEWPPGCGVGEQEQECGWPHCQPIGSPRAFPKAYLASIRRFSWWMVDTPE